MKYKINNVKYASIVALLTIVSACSKNGSVSITEQKDPMDSIIATIDACPSWLDVPKSDIATRERIVKIYSSLGKYDNATIRESLLRIRASDDSTLESRRIKDSRRAKCFAMMRVLFDISQGFLPVLTANGMLVTGEWGTPKRRSSDGARIETQNLLWPFDIKQGKLVLVGGGAGSPNMIWTGPVYDPVLEFDAMAERFKRRSAQ